MPDPLITNELHNWSVMHPRAERLILDANQLNFIKTLGETSKITSPDQLELPFYAPRNDNHVPRGTAETVIPVLPALANDKIRR